MPLDELRGPTDAAVMKTSADIDLPVGAQRLLRVPLAMAIGMRLDSCDAQTARGRLPDEEAVRLPGGGIDPLALLPFVDQLASVPLALAVGGQSAMSTIELSASFVRAPGAGALAGTARAASTAGAARLVTAEVADAAGGIVATCSAWFSIGKPPGGGGDPDGTTLDRPVDRHGPFQAMIGLTPDGDDGARLAADRWEAIGWTGLPALHGGAVAAALARAGQQRVATLDRADLRLAAITVRYLRAAGATGAVARATVDAIGRRTARLSATLSVDGAQAASAQLLFVAD